MTNIYKRLEKKRRREKYKRQITDEIVDDGALPWE